MVSISSKRGLEHFVGVDESNHGRFPEVFVAVSSTHALDAARSEDILPKFRGKFREVNAARTIRNLLKFREYHFSLIYEEHVDYLGVHAPKIAAIGQTVASFMHNGKTKVLIDGDGTIQNEKDIAHIISLTSPHHHTIHFEKQGDQHYQIVNIADAVAYNLYRMYAKTPRGEKGPFDEFLIPFDVQVPDKKRVKERYVRNLRRRQ